MAELSMERFTDTVVNAMGPKTSPRVREVMTALIRHLHDFAREVNLTTQEYLAACDFVVRIGQMSDERRNEAILASDIFGLESLVDFLDQHAAAGATPASTAEASDITSSAILGPFWRENAPIYPNGASIIQGGVEGGEMALVQGRVYGGDGQPIEGAIVNVWETAPNGLTSSKTRASRTTTCAGRSGPTRRAATPFEGFGRRSTRSPLTARPANFFK